ncbi:diadenylate cyclase [bacterium]|nr:diadenylate cyclase [bacterium]
MRQEAYESHYNLITNRITMPGGISCPIPTSLIDSSISEYLMAASRALAGTKCDPNIAPELNPLPDIEYIQKLAGKRLMWTPAYASRRVPNVMDLYDFCERISLQTYESAQGAGKIIVSKRDHADVRTIVTFHPEIPLRQIRAARKLLELTNKENSLLYDCEAGHIYGIGHIREGYDEKLENLFEIELIKHHTWRLLHAGRGMMVVSNGVPGLPSDLLDNDKLVRDLPRIFPGISQMEARSLRELAVEATKQTQGTMLVISGQAQEEANRLISECIKTDPFVLTKELIPLVTSVDGSVLLDPRGKCHAIGVILDGSGEAKGKCRLDRGARFNSAVRYINGKKECLAIVISEDSSVDLIPDLKPQISRTEIQDNLADLERIARRDRLTEKDTRELYELMEWLNHHEFYLTGEICSRVDALKENITSKWPDNEIRILFRDLRSNDEMDESYFLD